MKLLCKIGIHSWDAIAIMGIFNPALIYRCKRCGCGKGSNNYCWWDISKTEMDEMIGNKTSQVKD